MKKIQAVLLCLLQDRYLLRKKINFKDIANRSTSLASLASTGPLVKKDIEASKKRTIITEKQTELARQQTEQLFAKHGQAGISSLNNRGTPGTAGQISINPTTLPQFNSSNNTNNNASTIKSSLNQSPLTANHIAYNPFGASTSTSSINNKQGNLPRTTIINGWDGLNIAQSGGWLPPDVTTAPGPNHVVEMTNIQMAIWNKNGGFIQSAPLSTFFGTGNDFISDPKVVFDSLSGHWFATILDGGQNQQANCSPQCFVIAAVSSTDDPTGNWVTYWFPYGNSLPDQPIIATYNEGLVISVNAYDDICLDGCANVLVADKNAMIAAGTTDYQTTGDMPQEYSLHPAQSLSYTDCVYIPSVGHLGSTEARISSWCGSPSGWNAVWYPNWTIISMPRSTTPFPINEPNGITADSGDGRVLSASYYNGMLWWGFNDSCIPVGDNNPHACLRLQSTNLLSDPTALSVDTYVAAAGYDTFYPALTLDNSGNMIFIFGISGTTFNPSLIAGDSNWDFKYLVVGSSTVNDGRYGDYFGAGTDPSGQCAFLAGEYGSNNVPNSSSTFIGNVCSP